MKKICLCCLALLCLTNLFAQETVNYKEKKPYKTWVKISSTEKRLERARETVICLGVPFMA